MSGLLYIHGFLSSPLSQKARQMGEWLNANRPQVSYYCPFLTPYPDDTLRSLESIVKDHGIEEGKDLYLIGSSLGGFWATWLAEKYNLKSVLINPVVDLGIFKSEFINKELRNYHTNDSYILTEHDMQRFSELIHDEIRKPENYLLLLQTGDEVLDYQLAIDKYPKSGHLVENGGDHVYQGFTEKIEIIMDFFESKGLTE
jgi:predicted esterase YcpF (UPF0227 family)